MQRSVSPAAPGTAVTLSGEEFYFGREIVEFKDSGPMRGDMAALRERMAADGHLFFRGFFERELVLKAQLRVLEHLSKLGCLREGAPIAEGIASGENRSLGLFRDLEIAHSPEVLAVVDGAPIRDFFSSFLGGEILTYDKRWLRAMAAGGSSGWHYDSVFMSRGTKNLYTCWTPLGDIPLEQGPLALLLGSHQLERVKETYGQIDVDQDHLDPLFTSNPREMLDHFGCTLATTNFQAGDLLIFGIYMMHAGIPNTTGRYRISIDTRYQLASEPVDDRFMGKDGTWKGNYSFGNPAPRTPMSELRARWNL